MNDMIKTLQMALEALNLRCGTNADERKPGGAITALRAAIEAAENVEPSAWISTNTSSGECCIARSKITSKYEGLYEWQPLYLHPPSAEIEELERQLAECQRERDMLRKFHHDQQELHERNEANAQTNRLRLLQIVELRAACQMALDALEGCINDPKMRHTDTVHYATQDAHAKLCEVMK